MTLSDVIGIVPGSPTVGGRPLVVPMTLSDVVGIVPGSPTVAVGGHPLVVPMTLSTSDVIAIVPGSPTVGGAPTGGAPVGPGPLDFDGLLGITGVDGRMPSSSLPCILFTTRTVSGFTTLF